MMQRFAKDDDPTFDVYVGDTAYTDPNYITSNTQCLTGILQMGLGSCSGTGRYIIWKLTNGDRVSFSELAVYDSSDIAATSSSITQTGVGDWENMEI